MTTIRHLDTRCAQFESNLAALLERSGAFDPDIETTVRAVIAEVRSRGDAALLEYSARFDDLHADSVCDLEVPREQLQVALNRIDAAARCALYAAEQRIRRFNERQVQQSWEYAEADGTRLGQRVTALDRVGLYVPGGKAAYPSSVLMAAVPARVAGVGELIMVTPTPRGVCNDTVLAAAAIAGVDRVFRIGGAQAVAALAYGTASVPRVDKIVGPGNAYVATAKRLVYGHVGIDLIAGPSEVVVICDRTAPPEWVAMDLFAQAEHDEQAQSILLSPDSAQIAAVEAAIGRLLPQMERRAIIETALAGQGALVRTASIAQAVEIANRIAPEHLELMVADAASWVPEIRHAGAVFVGHHSAESLGDYCAGPSHVLPTSGTARFASPLGVYDFQKRTSVIACSPAGAAALSVTAVQLARSEGLTAHARSAAYRTAQTR